MGNFSLFLLGSHKRYLSSDFPKHVYLKGNSITFLKFTQFIDSLRRFLTVVKKEILRGGKIVILMPKEEKFFLNKMKDIKSIAPNNFFFLLRK